MKRVELAAACLLALTAVAPGVAAPRHHGGHSAGRSLVTPSIVRSPFGATTDGKRVDLYTLTNQNGLVLKMMTYGATVTELHVPDKRGKMGDIVLGYNNLASYIKNSPYFGATVGRYANRIAKGRFTLDGKTYKLAVNNGPNSLHGGIKGFDKVVWKAAPVMGPLGPSIRFTYFSPNGQEGYPGNLHAAVTYTLTTENTLRIEYSATSDRDTPINLTNHTYWNLAGGGSILDETVMLKASNYTPVDATLIPTGKIEPVKGTPMDFTTPHPIADRIHEVPGKPVGYDHNFVLDSGGRTFALAAQVTDPKTGRVLTVYTDQPGIQFYTGNFLDGTIKGKYGQVYQQHDALCLETQHFPDSPNHANFPSAILHPGQRYHTVTAYQFTTKK